MGLVVVVVVVPPPRPAESRMQEIWWQIVHFSLQDLNTCPQQIVNYLVEYKEIQLAFVTYWSS
jgi:hypothetical protein